MIEALRKRRLDATRAIGRKPSETHFDCLGVQSPIEILGSFYFSNIILPVNNVLVRNTIYGQAQEFMVHVFASEIHVLCMVYNEFTNGSFWGGTTTRGRNLNHFGSGPCLASNEDSSMKICEGV
jgi:hypothetical protein